MRSTGSGKEPAQPEEEPGTLRDARVAPDWLGERGAGARETRTPSPRDARQKQSPAERGASTFVSTSGRLSGPRSHSQERMRKGFSTRGATPGIHRELPADPLNAPGKLELA